MIEHTESTMSTESNRARLIAEARRLFSTKGYAEVSVDEVAAAAGVTKGAVYYQFDGKVDLFKAACEALIADVGRYVDEASMGLHDHVLDEIVTGGEKWLDAYESPGTRQMLLIDGPAVLGVEQWSAMQEPVGMGLIAHALGHLADEQLLEAEVIPALSQLLFGAFVQGALRIGASPDPETTSQEVRRATRALTQGLLAGAGRTS